MLGLRDHRWQAPLPQRRAGIGVRENWPSSSSFDMVQMPQGEVDIGLPTRAVGKSILGGDPELPCAQPDRSVDEFRDESGA